MKIAVLTGAGMSAESGLKTFRDSNGLWEGHDVMEVASPMALTVILNWYSIFTIRGENNYWRFRLTKPIWQSPNLKKGMK